MRDYVELGVTEEHALQRLAGDSDFFADLLEAYEKYGHLTEKQYACLSRQMDDDG